MGRAMERGFLIERELEDTDIHHPKNAKRIRRNINRIKKLGQVDRRTVYNDVDVLKEVNPNIRSHPVKAYGYYMEHEVQPTDYLLVTERCAQTNLLSEEEVREINQLLDRQMYPDARELLMHDYTVRCEIANRRGNTRDKMTMIIEAMAEKRRIQFQYLVLDRRFNPIPKHDGRWYDVSCYRFQVDSEDVYLYGADADARCTKTFRVNCMHQIRIGSAAMEPAANYYGEGFGDKIYRMVNESVFHFDGKPIRLGIRVRYESYIMEVLYRMFHGRIDSVLIEDEQYEIVWVTTRKSIPLCRMLASYGDILQVVEPEDVIEDIQKHVALISKSYGMVLKSCSLTMKEAE